MTIIDADSGAVVPDNATQPFPNPGETALDHAAQAAGRVLRQYQNSPKLQALIAGLGALAQRIENCLVSIPPLLDPTTTDNPGSTTNVNLDVVGALVGQARAQADGTVVTNAVLLQLIALRIARNTGIGSSPAFVAFLSYIFGAGPGAFRYIDTGGMCVAIEVATGPGTPPTAYQVALLDGGPTPRAMGVQLGREWYDPAEWFGFAEDTRTGAMGFGLESNPSVGGSLAMLF